MDYFGSPAASKYMNGSADIGHLLAIHEILSGTARGRRDLDVLNKSAIVLLCAYWEAFCEDLADDALHHLLAHSPQPSALPKGLQKRIAKELKEDPHELSPWKLAGDNWKAHLQLRLASTRARRNFDWNSPRSANADKLFDDVVGIPKVSAAWHWKHVSVEAARKKLDEIVALRGAIAHRGRSANYVKKTQVIRAVKHIDTLVIYTGIQVSQELEKMTGVEAWPPSPLPKVMVIPGK
jgi:hypothetical protein